MHIVGGASLEVQAAALQPINLYWGLILCFHALL